MRVLTFLHSFEPGGVERVALRLIRHWRGQGVDAPLFMGRLDGAMAGDVGAGLNPVVPRARVDTAAWETLWMIWTLPRAVRMLRPDVLFCAGNTYAIVAVALKLRLGRACPPIVAKVSNDLDRRDTPWPARLAYGWWLRVQGRMIDRFVGMAAPMTAEIAGHMRIAAAAVAIVPDPALSMAQIDALRAVAAIRPAAGRRFVAVGRLVAQKNLALTLRAFARGATPADHLTLIGDGPERAALERLARRLGVAERVRFAGYVADPAAMLPAFDVLLLSSNYEGVPAVMLEALAAGIAIVATDCSRSMASLLADGALGTLVPVREETAFADAIHAVRPGDQDRAASLAQARRFTIERAADAYLGVMTEAMAAAGQKKVPNRTVVFGRWRRRSAKTL